jgi:hypothetical protein
MMHAIVLRKFGTVFGLLVVDQVGGSLLQETMSGFRLLP